MATRKPRTTTPPAASRIADKYIGAKGKKAEAKAPADFDLSAASIKKAGRGKPAPEIRVLKVRERGHKLTAKEALFVEEYLLDFNAAAAARRTGYSEKTARQIGYELLTKPYIRAAVEQAKRDRLERATADHKLVLQGLLEDFHADIADLYDDSGALRPVHEWPQAFRRGLVAGIEVEEIWAGTGEFRMKIGELKKVRLADRTQIKKLLGDHTTIQAFNSWRKDEDDSGTAVAQLMREISGRSFRPKAAAGLGAMHPSTTKAAR